MKFKSILALIIFILVAVIFIQNTEIVEFKVYFWKLQMSRIILLPAILIIGFVIGYIVAKINRRKLVKQKVQQIKESVQPKSGENDERSTKSSGQKT